MLLTSYLLWLWYFCCVICILSLFSSAYHIHRIQVSLFYDYWSVPVYMTYHTVYLYCEMLVLQSVTEIVR